MNKTDPRFVPAYKPLRPNKLVIASQHIGTDLITIDLGVMCDLIEILNKSESSTLYVLMSTDGLLETVKSQGLPVFPMSFYSVDRRVRKFLITSDSPGTDVRILGHYTR